MKEVQYHIIHPVQELADVVRFFWIFEGKAGADNPFILRTVANGCPELLLHYKGIFTEITSGKGTSSFGFGIHGQTDQHRRFIVNEPFGIFGVYLYPYALGSLFNIPAIEFTNELPDLISICGVAGLNISDRMQAATCNEQRLQLMTDFLLGQKRQVKQREIAQVVKSIIARKGNVSIPDLSSQCFRSHRQFERNFKEHTGFTAKTFSRIVRFNALMQQRLHTEDSLTQIALDFGYYDQSHFIHDFKMFSGYSPGVYFSGKAGELL